MLTGQPLVSALAGLPALPAQGIAFRLIHLKYQKTPLSAIGSLKAGGRYNIAQKFAAFYTADSPVTALRELKVLIETAKGLSVSKAPPYVLLSIEYSLEAVVDLTLPVHQTALGTNLQELTGTWLPMSLQGQVAPTQQLGEAAYNSQHIEALKCPSALDPTAYNLVVFVDKLSPNSFLKVYDDSGTIQAKLP